MGTKGWAQVLLKKFFCSPLYSSVQQCSLCQKGGAFCAHVLRGVLCVLSGVLDAAKNLDADVEILYHAPGGCNRYVYLNKGAACVQTSGEQMQDLCDALSDQVLAGYYFNPKISGTGRRNPRLWQEEVLPLICHKKSFVSEELRVFFSKIAQVLRAGYDQSQLDVRDRLHAQAVADIYSQGRLWRVLSKGCVNPVCKDDVVCIFFRGKNDVLVGDFVSVKSKNARTPCLFLGSVLHAKRLCRGDQPTLIPEPPEPVEMRRSHFQTPLNECRGPYWQGVGIVYFPEGGGQVRGLFNVEDLTVKTQWQEGVEQCECIDLFSYMRREIFRGYELIYGSCDLVNAEPLLAPDVRKDTCIQVPFFSQSLRDVLPHFAEYLSMPDVAVKSDFWEGLQPQHFDKMYTQNQTMQWTLIEREQLVRFEMKKNEVTPLRGTLYVHLYGECDVLQGRPVFLSSSIDESSLDTNSLLFYLKRWEHERSQRKGCEHQANPECFKLAWAYRHMD